MLFLSDNMALGYSKVQGIHRGRRICLNIMMVVLDAVEGILEKSCIAKGAILIFASNARESVSFLTGRSMAAVPDVERK